MKSSNLICKLFIGKMLTVIFHMYNWNRNFLFCKICFCVLRIMCAATNKKPTKEELSHIVQYEGPYKTSGEYVAAVRSWLITVHQMQCWNMFLTTSFHAQQTQSSGSSISSLNQRTQSNIPATAPSRPAERGREYLIPSLWKRVAAEAIDFMLLFFIKLIITYIAVDFFDLFSDMDNVNLENLREGVLSDYRLTMNMTYDILVLEVIHRIGNCIFEALCLHRGARGVGGATPGKKVMGLRVVRCSWAVPTLDNQVLVFPATNLGLGWSLVRAIAKNVAITLLLPVCITMFMYQHNRTLYDVLSGSIVVEEISPAARNDNNNNR